MSLNDRHGMRQKRPPPSEREDWRCNKRTRFALNKIEDFSDLEQTILREAAKLLNISVERLLTAATDGTGSTSAESTSDTLRTSSTLEERSRSSSMGESAQGAGDGAPAESGPDPQPFDLRLPDISALRRARNLIPGAQTSSGSREDILSQHHSLDIALNFNASQGSPVWPWLSDSLEVNPALGFEDSELDHHDLLGIGPNPFEPSARLSSVPPHNIFPGWASTENNIPTHERPLSSASLPTLVPSNATIPRVVELDETKEGDSDSTRSDLDITYTPGKAFSGLSSQNRTKSQKSRRPSQYSAQQEQTTLTRRLGACIRCSIQRIRCLPDEKNPNGCCRTCTLAASTRLHWLPCLRYKIQDAGLLDKAVCPRPSWTLRWKTMDVVDITEWASRKLRTIEVTQDVAGVSYEFKVRRFVPKPGDALARKWKTNGIEQAFECAPYGIANMAETGKALAQIVDRTTNDQLNYYIDESDKLMRNTYVMASRYSLIAERAEERLLLRSLLRIWCASRMESRSERICGTETLGMKAHNYGPDCPNSGHILLPPVLGAQVEIIMTSLILEPARREVLRRLKDLILENRRSSWFSIYLCLFILLHSCAMLTAGDNKKARKQGMKARFFRPSLVEELHNGANILLAYFQHCNKGGCPFSMDWSSPDQAARMVLDDEQVEFMRMTCGEIKKKAELFRDIRKNNNYEHDYYFISQLYDMEWKPSKTTF